MTPCPTLDQLQHLLAETLPATDRTAIENHLGECSRCQQALETLAKGDSKSFIPGGSPRPHEFHPDFQPSLVNRIEEQLQNTPQPSDTNSRSLAEDSSNTTGLHGRFIKKEVLGKGGQGEVWLALDPELGRDVALKLMPSTSKGSPAIIAKFRHEAEVTGKLEHPNIVPIYEAGREQSDQTPYYVMRVLRDETLHAAILRFHQGPWTESGLRELLGRFIDVCQAVAYAHSRGVIHRDLKPQNVMLGQFGETLVVDWGLAKVIGRDEEHDSDDGEGTVDISAMDSDSATKTGSIKGTPKYMSPEQAAGRMQELGPPSDIYSLGAVLYCVLTGQAPFPGKSTSDILRRVQAGDFPRPREVVVQLVQSGEPEDVSPRTTSNSPTPNSPGANAARLAIPRPLEAICLRAMSLRPSDRYRTAAALAEDVQRWLADEPVSAWQEPVIVRAKRWVRHHQTLVTSAAAILLVAIVSLSALSIIVTGKNDDLAQSERRERTARGNAEEQERAAIAALALAETNAVEARRQQVLAEASAKTAREQSQLALNTLTSVIFDLQRAFQNVPGGAAVRQRLLATALEKLDQISTEFAAKAAVDRSTMIALHEMADTILQLGHSSPHAPREESRMNDDTPNDFPSTPTTQSAVLTAERLYRRAHEIAQQLAAANPNDAQTQRDLSFSLDNLGNMFLTLGRTGDALVHFQAKLKIDQALIEVDPKHLGNQGNLMRSLNNLGNVFLTLGRTDDALAQFQAYGKLCRVLADADPNDTQRQRNLSISFYKLGNVFLKIGRTDDALMQFQELLKRSRAAAEADPNDMQNQRGLAVSFNGLGDVFLKLGRSDDALAQYEALLKISRVMTEADPNDVEKQRDLGVSFQRLGAVLLKLGRTDDALVQLQASETISRMLAEADPNDAQKQHDLSSSFNNLGDIYLRLGRTNDALGQFQDGLKHCRALAESDPKNTENQRNLSMSFERLGDVLLQLGRTDDAISQFQAKLKIDQALVKADPKNSENQHNLATSLGHLGGVLLKLGRTAEALTQLQAYQQLCGVLAETDPTDAGKQRDLANSVGQLGDVFLKLGRTNDALMQYQAYEKRCRVLAEADPTDAQKQSYLSLSFDRLGDVFQALGRNDDALTQFQDGLKIRRVLAEADPNDAMKQKNLSVSFSKLGDLFLKLSRTDDALAQYEALVKNCHVLAEADPNNVTKQRDLSLSFVRLGDVFLKLDRTKDALAQFQAYEKLCRVLVNSDPNDALKQRELSVSLERLGDVFLTLGRTEDALTQFQEYEKLCRYLADVDPNDAQIQRDLSLSFNKLGDVFLTLGRTADALSQFQELLKRRRATAEADPNDAQKQHDLMYSHYKLGEVYVQTGQFDQAREWYVQGVAVLDGMIAKGQSTKLSQQGKEFLEQRRQFCTVAKLATGDWDALLKADAKVLPQLLILRATEMLKRGELVHAVQAGDRLRELTPKDKNNLYNAACVYARCAEFVTKDKPDPTDAEQAGRQKFLNLAIDCLKESLAAGWDDFDHLRKDEDLTPLRSLPEFQMLFPK
ncbi:MAG: tetratricopeptide repeat protein [Planctomycetales bacterium]|nr:tetratricopeptide repeat protein [Planctomycetales bacterium]